MPGITVERLLESISTEGRRVAALPAETLSAPVPGLAEWNVERVVRHLGRVHRWVIGLLAAPPDADPAEVSRAAAGLPRGPDCLPAYADALAEMLAAFAATDPTRPVASFLGPADVWFWVRRQTHELAVHRIDAQDAVHAAAGPSPDPLDPQVAADGVAEWLEVFAASYLEENESPRARPLADSTVEFLITDNQPSTRLVLHYSADGVGTLEVPDGPTDTVPDVVLAGPAGTLLLTLWRRRPLDAITVAGDAPLASTLLDTIRV